MILIIAPKTDFHAFAVKKGLESLGARSVRWGMNCWSADYFPSIDLQVNARLRLERNGEYINLADVDKVWYRREGSLALPDNISAASRIPFVNEWTDAKRALFHVLSAGSSIWVNPWVSAWRAENKLLQLQTARAIGFDIPKTLISNNHGDIIEFFRTHRANVIHKMFHPAKFGSATACTARLHAEVLENSDSLGICPGIYQEHLSIEFEVRVFIAGEGVVAAQLFNDSPGNDVKLSLLRKPEVFPYSLPGELLGKCRRLVASLGLISASLDLAFTKDGRWIFFEINQAGQFLWLELLNERIKCLDMFCRFLRSDTEGSTKSRRIALSAADYLQGEFSTPMGG